MAAKRKATTKRTTATSAKKSASRIAPKTAPQVAPKVSRGDVPNLFRINVEVGNLDAAAAFYTKLFGLLGRKQAGSRVYFTCGAVTLQVVDVSSVGTPHPAAKALYFTVKDLEAVYARAKSLGCLSREDIHGASGGQMTVRPWGERSFYVEDPWKNPMCFVEAGTIYPG